MACHSLFWVLTGKTRACASFLLCSSRKISSLCWGSAHPDYVLGSHRMFKWENHGGSQMSPLLALQVKALKYKCKVTSLNLLLASELLCQVSNSGYLNAILPATTRGWALFLSSKNQERSPLAACCGLDSQMSTFLACFKILLRIDRKGFPLWNTEAYQAFCIFFLTSSCLPVAFTGKEAFFSIKKYSRFIQFSLSTWKEDLELKEYLMSALALL